MNWDVNGSVCSPSQSRAARYRAHLEHDAVGVEAAGSSWPEIQSVWLGAVCVPERGSEKDFSSKVWRWINVSNAGKAPRSKLTYQKACRSKSMMPRAAFPKCIWPQSPLKRHLSTHPSGTCFEKCWPSPSLIYRGGNETQKGCDWYQVP